MATKTVSRTVIVDENVCRLSREPLCPFIDRPPFAIDYGVQKGGYIYDPKCRTYEWTIYFKIDATAEMRSRWAGFRRKHSTKQF